MRKLLIQTQHGTINTPAFLPDATYGSIKAITFDDAKKAGINEIVTTTLHLENKIGSMKIKQFGGLHKFFNWNRPILTDSGGFQVYSLIHASKNKVNKITDAGCSFIDPETGSSRFLSPEISQIIQFNLGADIVTALDEPTNPNASVSFLTKSIKRNTEWAKRSKEQFLKLHDLTEADFNNPKIKRPLIGAVIQGGGEFKLREQSAKELIEIGFDMYNFGGVPLMKTEHWRNDRDRGFYHELLTKVAELIPEDKIRYAMGVGTPDDIIFCANKGWDIFDTVLPTRNARHGYLYVGKGKGDSSKRSNSDTKYNKESNYKKFENYDVLHITNKEYEFDEGPIDSACDCEACKTVSRAYLRHLLKINEPTGYRLTTIHNLRFYSKLMSTLRS